MPPQINEGGGLLRELSLFCVRCALQRNQLSELSFFRGSRALRLLLHKVSLTPSLYSLSFSNAINFYTLLRLLLIFERK